MAQAPSQQKSTFYFKERLLCASVQNTPACWRWADFFVLILFKSIILTDQHTHYVHLFRYKTSLFHFKLENNI